VSGKERPRHFGIGPIRQARDGTFDVGKPVDGEIEGLDGEPAGKGLDRAPIYYGIGIVGIVDCIQWSGVGRR
jgi:hypothetical protein